MTKTPAGRRRAPKGEGDRLRTEILDVAEELLIGEGKKEAVTIRQVASAVGVSPPSIYLHFSDKDELFYEVCRRVFAELYESLIEAADRGTVIDRLRRAGEAYIRFGLDRPSQYETLFACDLPDNIEEERWADDPGAAALGLLSSLLEEGVESGELKTSAGQPASVVAIWAAVHGLVHLLATRRDIERHGMIEFPPDDELAVATLDLILDGIRA